MKRMATLIASSTLILASTGTQAAVIYQTISFDYNSRMQTDSMLMGGNTYPTGHLEFGGIPFYIPETGDNYWNSNYPNTPNPHTLDVNINLTGAIEVHTLLNTFWGQPGPDSYAAIEFIGSNGGYYKVDLIGNDHIRDYNQYIWTNSINNTTTIEVFNNGSGQRLDKQVFYLPDEFENQNLESIRITDNGATNSQRLFVSGITVGLAGAIPAPSALLLLLLSLPIIYSRKHLKNNL